MKKLISGLSALTLAGLMSITALADTTVSPGADGKPAPSSAGTEVSYDVTPSYTVTIPAGADITTGEQTKSITLAEGALLAEGSKIEVKLEKGEYTASGNAFTAKTASGNSSVSYQINGGNIKVGDTVASLDKDTLSADLTFAKTDTVAPTYAGKHTEVLTFAISVAEAEASTQKSVTIKGFTDTEHDVDISDFTINYEDGDKWSDVLNDPDALTDKTGLCKAMGIVGYKVFPNDWTVVYLYNNSEYVSPDDEIDSTKEYKLGW